MKQALAIYFILLTTFAYCQASSPGRTSVNPDSIIAAIDKKNNDAIGKPFPKFAVFLNGKKYSNATLKGKIVFINFWFSSCAPCIAEFDELNNLLKKYSVNKNFEFVSFTFEDQKEIDLVKKEHYIQYNVFSIPRSECYRLDLNNGFPTNIIVNPSGSVKFVNSGGQIERSEIKKYFTNTIYPLISKEL